MPLNKKGKKIMKSMKDQYGSKRGEKVFYASMNKGNIRGVEKMKNGGLGKRFGPPPKKGPDSQGLQVTKLQGGGMDMGNAASQAKSASMGNASSAKSTSPSRTVGGGNRPNPHTPSGTSIETPVTQRQLQRSRNFQQQQQNAIGQRALDTHQVGKVPFFVPGSAFINVIQPLRQKSFEKNREYFQKNVAGKQGFQNTLTDYKRYISGRGTGDLDAMGRPTVRNDRTDNLNTPFTQKINSTLETQDNLPIGRRSITPYKFDFQYRDGGLVRGSGKVLKGKVKKTRIY